LTDSLLPIEKESVSIREHSRGFKGTDPIRRKNKVKSISKIAVTVLGLALLAGGAWAQGSGGPHGGPHGDFLDGHMLGFFADYLDLTDAQQAQIKQIGTTAKPAMKPLFEQERTSHQQMMQLIESGSFDNAKATAIANQEAQVRAQIEVQKASIASQSYQVLTSDQKTKLNEFITKREQRWAQHSQAPSETTPNQ
jgi:Spy/CpxP family protein refolding chaperone